MTGIVEIVKFRLRDSVDISKFFEINRRVDAFLSIQDGMLARAVCFDADAYEYTDIVHWRDQESANRGQDAYFESDVGTEMGNIVIKSSFNFVHNQLLSSFSRV